MALEIGLDDRVQILCAFLTALVASSELTGTASDSSVAPSARGGNGVGMT